MSDDTQSPQSADATLEFNSPSWVLTSTSGELAFIKIDSLSGAYTIYTPISPRFQSLAHTNPASASSLMSSLIAEGSTPAWYSAVPTYIQNVIYSSSLSQNPPDTSLVTIPKTVVVTSSSSPQPTISPQPTESSSPKPSNNADKIAGAVVGALAGLALVISTVFVLLRRRRRMTPPKARMNEDPGVEQKFLGSETKHFSTELGNEERTMELDTSLPAAELPTPLVISELDGSGMDADKIDSPTSEQL
ncbi:MAG: hypothetical protein M1820_006203 [Bogoriella megaspora]|nr:MAG: hypothetical protein M1820_006203 [Bogoriella megaspora]